MNYKQTVVAGILVVASNAFAAPNSYWKADGNTQDSMGTNNGTAVGTVNYTAGHIGQGWLLQGDGYVNVANPVAGGLQDANGFTVAAWIRMDSEGSVFGTGSIVNLRTAANTSGFTLEEEFGNPNTIAFDVNTSGTTAFNLVSAGGWSFGTFYQVAASYDAASGALKLYRDGALLATQFAGVNSPMVTNPASLFEMGNNIPNGSEWNGVIDDVQFYRGALSDSDVANLYAPSGTPEPFTLGFGGAAVLLALRRKIKR